MNDNNTKALFKLAMALAIFTVIYNLLEGVVSVYFGFNDETISLFGFGIDSFMEVISGLGIAVMIGRIRQHGKEERSTFEKQALRITGFGFYGLAAGLVLSAAIIAVTGHKPETTLAGIIISLISIAIMYWLYRAKNTTGIKLNSAAITADAQCTMVCIYMSLVLLAASGIYEITGIGYADALGSAGLAWFSWKEGKECFEKVRNNSVTCTCHN